MFKRILSTILMLCMCISLLGTVPVNAATDLATFNSKLSAFKTERYAHNSIYQDNPDLTGGYQCFGYANELALYIWGSYPTNSMSAASVNTGWTVTYGGNAIDSLCVGDIVRYHYHSIFITGISGDTIYYCHANSPSGTNKVTYDNTISRSSLKSKVSEQLTSPNTTKTGWVAHFTNGFSSSNPEEQKIPGKPSFNNTKTTYTNKEEITFTWNDTTNTSYYNWYIDQYDANSDGYAGDHYVRIGNALKIESVTRTLPIGKYKVQVVAYNGAYHTDSDWYYFEVVKATSFITSIATKANNTYTIKTNLHNITDTNKILVACYKNNQLVTMKILSYSEAQSPCTLTGDIDEIKVMAWSDLSTLKPLCDAEAIPESEFITE